jgi:hypothetical protein
MTEPKFTRDGWHVEGRSVCIGDTVYVPAMWCKDKTEEECKANAHLIAAAPQMYAALQAVCSLVENHICTKECHKCIIGEALRKARGESEASE